MPAVCFVSPNLSVEIETVISEKRFYRRQKMSGKAQFAMLTFAE
jgi:hypothetical protein